MRPIYFFSLATISPRGSRITTPGEAGPGLPREPPSILARYAAAGAFDSAAASAKSLAPRFADGGLDITKSWRRKTRRCQTRVPDRTREWVRENTESSRSFRSERVRRWRPG